MSGWRTNGNTILTRYTEVEIDAAIADLEKRGFVLLTKEPQEATIPEYKYKDSSMQKNFYKGTQQVKKWIAVDEERRIKMGSSKHWNKEQIQYLHDKWGVYSIKGIAKNLGKSVSAIKQKAKREGLSNPMLHFDGITLCELLKALNKSYSYTAKSWIELYGMPVKKKVFASSKPVKVITYQDFWMWAENHKELINWAKVEENILGPEPDWVKVKRSADRMRSQRTWLSTGWTKQEDQKLLQLVKLPDITYPELSNHLNRSETSIRRRLYDLNSKYLPVRLDNHIKYTDEQIQILKQMAVAGYGYETIAQKIGKSALGVRGKLERMNFDFKARKFKEVVNQ